MGCPAARGRQRRRVCGASSERQAEKVGQQAQAEIDPRPDKEEEADSGRPHDPSFIGPAVQGGGDDPERCVVTRIGRSHWTPPPRDPAATAGSGLILHPARHRRAVELLCSKHRDTNRPKSRAVLWRLAEGRVGPACPFGHPRRAAVVADQCACFVRTSCGLSDPGRTTCLSLVVAASRRRCEKISAVHRRYWWPRWRAKIDGKMPL